MIKSKKAYAGTTFIWIIATIIIAVMMIFFILALVVYSEDPIKVGISSYSQKLSLTEDMITQLNLPLENGKTLYEVLSALNIEDSDQVDEASSLFDESFNEFIINHPELRDKPKFNRVEISIYPVNKEESFEDFRVFGASIGGQKEINCDPFMKDTILISIPIVPDKKIVLCANEHAI